MELSTVSVYIIVCVSSFSCESDVERIDTNILPEETEESSILPETHRSDYIRLSSNDLEKTIPIEEISTTKSYEDLAKNQELLKFVARNGYQVWKKMLVSPSNTTYFDNVSPSSTLSSTNHFDNFKSEDSINEHLSESRNINRINNIDVNREISSNLLEEAINNRINSFIEPVQLIPVFAKDVSITTMPIPIPTQSSKSIYKSTTRKSKKKSKKIEHKSLNVQKKKSFFGSTNIIGRVVISGFKGFINGITSLFGWWI